MMRSLSLLSALLLLLVACATVERPPKFPEMRFTDEPALRLDVARVLVQDRYRPPLAAPNVEHTFPVPLAVAAQNWARDRFEAVGSAGTALIVIDDASATLKELATDKTLAGRFKEEQAEELSGRLSVRIEITGRAPHPDGYVEARAARSRSLPEKITENDRERAYYSFARELTEELDATMQAAVRDRLRAMLR